MDVGAFVQENKRWLLGCGIGGVVWLIASVVVDTVYAYDLPSAQRLGAPKDVYNQAALAQAREENEKLLVERQRLQQELAFVPAEKYRLEGKGNPDEYLFQIGRALKQSILAAGDYRDVQVTDAAIVWDVPNGIDEQRATLFGLELLDETQKRLFAAHDAARVASPDGIGLRAVLSLRLDSRRGQRYQARSTRPGEVDVREHLAQEQLSFQFQADESTLAAFLESCRQPGRTLVVDAWQVLKPQRPGEPCTVKGTLLGIAFKAQPGDAPGSDAPGSDKPRSDKPRSGEPGKEGGAK